MTAYPVTIMAKIALITLIFCFIFLGNPLLSEAHDYWTISNVEQKQLSNNGLKEIINFFKRDHSLVKEKEPELYFYLQGLSSITRNDFQSAHNYYDEAYSISKTNKNDEVSIATLKRLIELSDYYGDSGELIDYGGQLLELAKAKKDVQAEMFAYSSIAASFFYLANDEQTNEYLEQMIVLATKEGDYQFKGIYYNVLGHLSYSYQEYKSALTFYEKANYYFNKSNKHHLFHMNLMTEGFILSTKSKLATTQEEKDKILGNIEGLIERTKKNYLHVPTLHVLYLLKGQIEQEFSRTAASINSFEKTLELLQSVKHVEKPYSPLRYVEMLLATSLYEQGEFQQAADLFIKVIDRHSNPELLKEFDKVNSKVRTFSEKQYTETIDLLSDLQAEQNRKIYYQWVSLILLGIVILFLIGAVIWKIKENHKMNQLKNQLYYQSITDGLTGVFNRNKIFEILDKEVKKDSVIALVDIDNFKSINDSLGYLVGDEVIKRVVETIKMSLRENDKVGRYGGEEFIVIIKETDLEDAVKIVERIRKNVEALEWEYDQLKTTISAGVCKMSNLASIEAFKEVDYLVHEAKRTGKNKVLYKPVSEVVAL